MDACSSIRVMYVFLHVLFILKCYSYLSDMFLCSSSVHHLEERVLHGHTLLI
jgi:hypothetical protein